MRGEWNGALLYIDVFGVILTCRVYPLSGYLLRPSTIFICFSLPPWFERHSCRASPCPLFHANGAGKTRQDYPLYTLLPSRPVYPLRYYPPSCLYCTTLPCPALPALSFPPPLPPHTSPPTKENKEANQEQAGPPSTHPAILVIPSPIPISSHLMSRPFRSSICPSSNSLPFLPATVLFRSVSFSVPLSFCSVSVSVLFSSAFFRSVLCYVRSGVYTSRSVTWHMNGGDGERRKEGVGVGVGFGPRWWIGRECGCWRG